MNSYANPRERGGTPQPRPGRRFRAPAIPRPLQPMLALNVSLLPFLNEYDMFPLSVQAHHPQLTFRLKGNDEKEQETEELNFSFAIVYRASNLVG